MSELLGLTIVSISVIGLIYSIGNFLLIANKPTQPLHSFDNLIAFQKGFFDGRQKLTEVEHK